MDFFQDLFTESINPPLLVLRNKMWIPCGANGSGKGFQISPFEPDVRFHVDVIVGRNALDWLSVLSGVVALEKETGLRSQG